MNRNTNLGLNRIVCIVLTLPCLKAGDSWWLPKVYRLTSSFLIGRTPSYGYAISPRRAEHIVLYAVCLSPTNSVELQIFIAPKRSLWIWNPHSQV